MEKIGGYGALLPFLVGSKWREEDRSNLDYTGAGILVSAASVCSEHTGSLWFYSACASKAEVN